jgi:colicin import membrane protein
MTRLQKKCLIVTAGTHLLLVVLLLCSGFIAPKPKVDDTQVLDVIPANLIDAAFNSGVKSAPTPPPAQPIVKPEATPPPTPTPEPTKPTPTPPTLMEKVKEIFKPDPIKPVIEDPTPVEKPIKPEHKIKVDLTVHTRTITPKKTEDDSKAEAEAEAKEQKKIHDQKVKAFRDAARSIKQNTSSTTVVDTMPGASSVSYANYASVVKSIYTQAWTPPDDTASDDANVRVSVVIARDGTVVTSSILTSSGDSSVDRSVQRTLDRVNFIEKFPDGSKEREKTFIINFNLKAKRMLG